MSILIGSSTAFLRATKQYYKFGDQQTNMKDSTSMSMNLQQILRKSVSRLETDFQHKLIIIIIIIITITTHEKSW